MGSVADLKPVYLTELEANMIICMISDLPLELMSQSSLQILEDICVKLWALDKKAANMMIKQIKASKVVL